MSEAYTPDEIRAAYDKHAHDDDWGVPSFYVEGLLDALRGKYDQPASSAPATESGQA